MATFSLPPAPSVPMLDGVPNSVSIAWYLFFQGVFTALGGGQAPINQATLAQNFVAQRLSLTVPNWLSVGGSPVGGATGINGTLKITSANGAGNLILATPDGGTGLLSLRALVGGDLPNPGASTLGGVQSKTVVAHQFLNTISTAGVPGSAQPASTDLSDTTAPATFAPTDQSGAGLSFTAVNVQYAKYGNEVYMYGTLTYPATADGAAASISVPVAVPNHSYAAVPGTLLLSGNTGSAIQTVQNTSAAAFAGAAGALTNANLSGKILKFSLIYPAS